jgi:hypothetical protein
VTAELLIEFTRNPGLLTVDQCQEVKEFLTKFNDQLTTFRAAYGDNARGHFVESMITKAEWYVDFHSQKG